MDPIGCLENANQLPTQREDFDVGFGADLGQDEADLELIVDSVSVRRHNAGTQVEVADQAAPRGGGYVHRRQARILFSHALQNARVRVPHPSVEAGRRFDQPGIKGDRYRVAAIDGRQGDAQGVV